MPVFQFSTTILEKSAPTVSSMPWPCWIGTALRRIVVDLGTATTFNAITRKGEYQGGLIAPGIELSAATLIERAAKLPRIDIGRPRTLIGQSTAESMQSGFFWGYVSLVDGIVGRMIEELGEDTIVIATGGMARFIDGESKFITKIDENLTLDGLFLVGRRLGAI